MRRGLSQRRIVPELLDSLPADDPRAIGSRRDLAWINALMFQSAIMTVMLRKRLPRAGARILEIGCGDGAFMLSVARRLGRAWNDVELVMVDQAALVSAATLAEFAALGWRVRPVVGDIFEWIDTPQAASFEAVSANLLLHHFSDEALVKLFGALSNITPVFIATEPSRNAIASFGCLVLKIIGCNDVTMHDAAASVRAGFNGSELTRLWPAASFHCRERRVGPFTHIFAAEHAR